MNDHVAEPLRSILNAFGGNGRPSRTPDQIDARILADIEAAQEPDPADVPEPFDEFTGCWPEAKPYNPPAR